MLGGRGVSRAQVKTQNIETKEEPVAVEKKSAVTQRATTRPQTRRDAFDAFPQPATAVTAPSPLKGGSADKAYDGQFVGANGSVYPSTTPLGDVPALLPQGGIRNNETLIYINGITVDTGVQAGSMQKLADVSGSKVVGLHNATEGVASDLMQAIKDKLNLGANPAVDGAADTIYRELKAGRGVHLVAHSQGALITSCAVSDVARRLKIEDGMSESDVQSLLSRVKVETFGGAAARYPDGPQYVHYVNRGDPVPTVSGLGQFANWSPLASPGEGAKVRYFSEFHLNPSKAHGFEEVYLAQRVPFEQAHES